MKDLVFSDLPSLLNSDDLLLFNATRVSRRKLQLRRATGGRISSLFLKTTSNGLWACLIKGSGKLQPGELLSIDTEEPGIGAQFRYHERNPTDAAVEQSSTRYLEPVPAWKDSNEAEQFFERHGQPPLPPYMKREAGPQDSERYQTVYARHPGSVAGPTAGFHFTKTLLDECVQKGVRRVELDLQIGYGTFAPLEERNFQERHLHTETYQMQNAELLNNSRNSPRIAVGTTTLRALEDNYRRYDGEFHDGKHETSLFVYPPDQIRSIQGLITNFHLPRSSLFLLVCAFGGRELLLKAYEHAIRQRYRFYSYGDAMFII